MSRVASRFLVVVMATLLATGWLTAAPAAVQAATPTELYFSEYIEGSSNNKALEIFNGTGGTVDLAAGAYSVQMFFNGSATAGLTINLTGTALASGDVYVLAQSLAGPAILAQADQTSGAGWFNGDDAVVLRKGTTIIDSLGQAGFDPGTEWGTGLTSTADNTLRRKADVCAGDPVHNDAFDPAIQWDGFAIDTFDGLGTYTADCDDAINLAINDVSATEPADSQLYNFIVSLSNPAGPGGVTFDIATQDGSATATPPDNDYIAQSLTGQSIPEGESSYAFSVTVNGDTTFEEDETFFVNVTNVTGATLVDGEGVGTIVNNDPEPCGSPATFIHDIQGTGTSAALTGVRTIEGVVVGDYQGSGQFGGYHVQEEAGDFDADPLTSEGIFVFNSSTAVNVGDVVRVRGSAGEFSGMTQLSSVTTTLICSTGNTFSSAPVTLPVAAIGDWERWEGMHIAIAQELSVTELFTLGRFGEVALSVGGRLDNPTNVVDPGAPAVALQSLNNRSRILLDDANNQQNIDPTRYPQGGLSASNTLRVGDTLPNLSGVLEFRFSVYRVQPVDLSGIVFDHTNPRPVAPAPVGGNLQVAALNVLNYFNGNGTGLDGAAGGFPTARGATSLFEFNRQRDKIINAIAQLDAAVVGLMELENDDTDAEFGAIEDLVAGLNLATAPGTYDFIDTGVVGTDAIRVGIIFQPAMVVRVGTHAIIDSDVDPRFIDTLNRPSVAQTFALTSNGARFTVVVNHLKSKGSDCNAVGDPDTGDGQGNCNGTRTAAAEALVDWIAGDPTDSGDPDVVVIGDMNAYAMEDPIGVFEDAGYVNTINQHLGAHAYSFVFQGQSGYLDHALASPSFAAQISGVTEWHVNADEPVVLDYNVEFKTANHVNTLYADDAYRSSDHDPVLVGIDLAGVAPTIAVSAGLSCMTSANGGTFAITVGDSEQGANGLVLSLEGNTNPTLVPNANVVFGGAGADRTVAITAANKRSGTALLTIGVSDGESTTTVTISVLVGTDADETFTGTTGTDLILGGAGSDIIIGLGGADALCGGQGDDSSAGGDGADVLDGDQGTDSLSGGNGNDVLRGGQGNDTLTGGADADAFSGGSGADTNTDFTPPDGDTWDGT